jgi:hypothetical protein
VADWTARPCMRIIVYTRELFHDIAARELAAGQVPAQNFPNTNKSCRRCGKTLRRADHIRLTIPWLQRGSVPPCTVPACTHTGPSVVQGGKRYKASLHLHLLGM